MANIVQVGLRALQFLLTLLILALQGNAISLAIGGNPSVVNYVMFVAVIAMLTLLYLIPVSFREGWAGHAMVPMILDILNTFLFFTAAVALAAELGVNSCMYEPYTSTNVVTSYSYNNQQRCQEEQANTAFLFFGFAAFAASTFFSVVGMGGGSSMGRRAGMGGIRRGPPAMSQV